jgi:electron transport complex protein RnfB
MPNGRGGRGRMKGFGLGPGGECMCTDPKCGHAMSHQRGTPCYQIKCPKCGSPMTRKG